MPARMVSAIQLMSERALSYVHNCCGVCQPDTVREVWSTSTT
jgi:hypothetical protein